jgi:hypothetical protein
MGSRYALIVATDQYSEPGLRQLAAPARDAEALAEVLGDPGVGDFAVTVLNNEPAQEVRLAIEDFFADRDRSDTLLLHFSGHGMKNAAGELFLAAADTRPSRLASTAVGSDFLSRQMADSRAERIVLLLDCCYGGAFPRGMVVRADSEAQVLEAFAAQSEVAGGKGRAVVTASSAMEYSFEEGDLTPGSGGTPSVFTSALVEGLESGEADTDGDGWVGLHELFEFVSNTVRTRNANQTPHMWTFGSQGELLIARSKVRRIRPTPLSHEVSEALTSPLAATRFGVVDLMHQRLLGDDLGLAATALETLRELLDDDSRRVAEAAGRAIEDAMLRADPDRVLLSADEKDHAESDVSLVGPPIARVVTVTTDDSWIRAVYPEPILTIIGTSPGPGGGTGAVTVTGPTGSLTVPVVLAAAKPAEPTPAPEEPEVVPEPVVAAEPVVTQPVRNVAPMPETAPAAPPPVGVGARQWVLCGVFLAAAVVLLAMNLPGDPEQYFVYYDETTGWKLYRSPDDPWVMAAVVCVASAFLTFFVHGRSRPYVLGILLGGVLFLIDDGLTFLALGFAYEDAAAKWTVTVLVGGALAALILATFRPRLGPFVAPGWRPLALLGTGAALMVANELIVVNDMTPVDVFGPLVYLYLVVLTTVAVLALCSPSHRTRELLAATAATMQLLMLYGAFLWRDSDQLGEHMAVVLPATVLIIAALAVGLRSAVRREQVVAA